MDVKITNKQPASYIFIYAALNFSPPFHHLLLCYRFCCCCFVQRLYCFLFITRKKDFFVLVFSAPKNILHAVSKHLSVAKLEAQLISHTYAQKLAQTGEHSIFIRLISSFVFSFSIHGLCIWGYHSEYLLLYFWETSMLSSFFRCCHIWTVTKVYFCFVYVSGQHEGSIKEEEKMLLSFIWC